jgi:ribosome-associated translation inhibitor RaiA
MHVDVTVRGPVAADLARQAAEKVGALERFVKGPVMGARVVLTQEENARIELPARAEGQILLAGRPVRARVAAAGMSAAVDELAERLQGRLRDHVDRLMTGQRARAEAEPGEWHHAAWAPAPPPIARRPPGERRLVRRKTFALEPMSALEAAADLAALDHTFYLYRDADTGADAVLYRRDDGRLAVIAPADAAEPGGPEGPVREPSRYSEPLELSAALAEMDALNHRFLYFTDAATGRGSVLYLRFDGHYGLIEPAS